MSPELLYALLSISFSIAGLCLAFKAWKDKNNTKILMGSAISLWILATVLWCFALGMEIGIAVALETAAILAFLFILLRSERREDKKPKDRQLSKGPKPPLYHTRGLIRFMLAGPLAFVAAMAIAIVTATQLPLNEQTRLILSALIVPSLWAVIMIYAIMGRRLLHITGVIMFVSVPGLSLYLLGGH